MTKKSKNANKSTKNPADSMSAPALVKAGDTYKPFAEMTADQNAKIYESLEPSAEQRIENAVNARVQAELAARGIDAATDSLEAVEGQHHADFVKELASGMLNLANLFDIDIEQVDPTAEPVQYAKRAFVRDLCYMSKRNITYNSEMLSNKATQLTGMINRHDGSDQFDEKISNMETFMHGIEDQMELWTCAYEAARDVYFEIWGSEYGAKPKASNVTHLTDAVRSATTIANRYLKHGKDTKANREDTERRGLAAENDELRRQIDQLSRTG